MCKSFQQLQKYDLEKNSIEYFFSTRGSVNYLFTSVLTWNFFQEFLRKQVLRIISKENFFSCSERIKKNLPLNANENLDEEDKKKKKSDFQVHENVIIRFFD